jgi:hypothetical protein
LATAVPTQAGASTALAQAPPQVSPLVAAPLEALAAHPAVRRHHGLFDSALDGLLADGWPIRG